MEVFCKLLYSSIEDEKDVSTEERTQPPTFLVILDILVRRMMMRINHSSSCTFDSNPSFK